MPRVPPASGSRSHRARRRGRIAGLREALAAAAGSVAGRLVLLAAMVVVVWLASAALAALTDASSSYGMALWSGLRHLFDPGSLGDDETAAQRIVGVVQVFTGLVFLAGVALTILADGVERGLRRLSETQPRVTGEGHLLVIGSGPIRTALLAALPDRAGRSPVETVVTLSGSGDAAPPPGVGGHRLIARRGDPRDPAALAGAAAAAARAIAVVGDAAADPDVADLAALEIAAALAEHLDGAPGPPRPVAVHVRRIADVEHAWSLLPPNFDAVPDDRNVGSVLALIAATPRYASSLAGSAAGGDPQLRVMPVGELAGLRFGAAFGRCAPAVPLGLLREGRAEYAPAAELTIAPGDGLIVIAADGAGERAAPPPAEAAGRAAMALEPSNPGPVRVLTLGWGPDGADMLGRLPAAVAVTVLAALDDPAAVPPPARLRPGDPLDAEAIAAAIAEERPAAVIALGGGNGASGPDGAHARAALAALKVSRICSQPELAIVVAQDGSASARRLRSADPRILVVSRAELVAQALLLSSTDRASLEAREAFVGDERIGLAEVRARGEGPAAFAAVYRDLLERRAVPLALSRDGQEFDLLDPAAAVVHPDDGLLVLRRGDGPRG